MTIKSLADDYLLKLAVHEIVKSEKRRGQNYPGNHITIGYKQKLTEVQIRTRCKIFFYQIAFTYDIYMDEEEKKYYLIDSDGLILYIGTYNGEEDNIIEDCRKHNMFIQAMMICIKKKDGLDYLISIFNDKIKDSIMEVQPYRDDYLNSKVYKLQQILVKKKIWIQQHMRRAKKAA